MPTAHGLAHSPAVPYHTTLPLIIIYSHVVKCVSVRETCASCDGERENSRERETDKEGERKWQGFLRVRM